MRIRFLADADLNHLIILAIKRREPAIDFQTAQDGGLAGLKDPQVLARAAHEGRILVSHDQSTMPVHYADFVTTNNSPGVIMIPQHLPILAAVEDLILMWAASEAEEWENQLKYLPL